MSAYLFDLSAIRSIPICDVCCALGLDVEKHGRNLWCKVRQEQHASVILHSDTNTFYDFGNGRKGSVIDLVQYSRNCSTGEAIRFLGKSFGIEPSLKQDDLISAPMSDWEYQVIGLHGDRAGKNISFPVETATTDELLDLSYAYQMPMNQLRRESPNSYEDLLRDKAIPYVLSLRNQYYLSVWNYYDFLCTFQKGYLFYDTDKTRAKFQKGKESLERADRILSKAVLHTAVEPPDPQNYDPFRILSRIQQGRLNVSLGPLEQLQVSWEARYENCRIRGEQISYDDYFSLTLDPYRHSADFNGKFVQLFYLAKDEGEILPQIRKLRKHRKPSLTQQISSAGEKGGQLEIPAQKVPEKEPVLS